MAGSTRAFAFAWRTVVALGLTWLAVGTRSLRWPILVHFLADASALAAIQVA
jgi:membrane protease YdiL (CAAX protease family)